MKKRDLLIGLIFVLVLLFVVTLLLVKNREKEDSVDDINNTPPIDYGMVLEKEYKPGNTWEYRVTGQFPSPCYSAVTEEIVRESFPEQVTIIVNISKPSDDMICTQVITNYEYEGTFSASEKAIVKLDVKD
jgi:hypothetical protein